MYEKMEPLKFATLSANVPDLDVVLGQLYSHFKLAPFLRCDLEEPEEGITPIALIRIGEHTLELLGRVEAERPKTGVICCAEIEAPVTEKMELEPAPGMKILCYPGEPSRIKAIEILTSMPKEDAAAFIDHTGATMSEPGSPLDLNGVTVRLVKTDGLPSEEPPELFFPGWHRLSMQVSSVTESYDSMAASGSNLRGLLEPFQIMPGIKEAMLSFPSHLILQITEESRLKMTPSLTLEWVKAKFSGHRMRVKSQKI
jgi:hypothetical protein